MFLPSRDNNLTIYQGLLESGLYLLFFFPSVFVSFNCTGCTCLLLWVSQSNSENKEQFVDTTISVQCQTREIADEKQSDITKAEMLTDELVSSNILLHFLTYYLVFPQKPSDRRI